MKTKININKLQSKKILKARAAMLSKDLNVTENDIFDEVQLIKFKLGSEYYSLEIQHVQEVCRYRDYTLLPGNDPLAIGLINLHGQIYSLLDLKNFFELSTEKEITPIGIIFLSHEKIHLGVIIDSMTEIYKVASKSIQTGSDIFKNKNLNYIQGVTGDGVAIIDVEKIFSDQVKNIKKIVSDEKSGETL